ncbi:MAG TPA: carbon monoxide dehydrogenase [Bdellovibrionales bacterium]|nr:MAG: hypothetical protein A2Z97_15420 [Bdellovibrionales bacterium GWB1_52_6]OFZ04264.1 MAG: hypothetical protein A2X97_06345 [Bdellovibrionales bacterium GWA1_52_35]OFZ42915.1 MAG: hypothetical protein A2070_04610 [Bdellovibrionales bacterium GWC1_52_8]HAR42429.1 carbon monoxide dehydrogenase [Bdellovibrionales bacterium]HCM40890.1 carbon monoxide dehydrogenase [Bdellovibrionales bacterium]
MRGYVPAYEVKSPETLTEALSILQAQPGKWKPLAGGTDLMVLLESGVLENRNLLNLQGLKELTGISVSPAEITIGALSTFRQILEHDLLKTEFPLLAAAARSIGAIAIQNRATIGGNIANASPAADSPPALIAHDAVIELVSSTGSRRLSYAEFHQGYKKTQLATDELIRAIILPRTQADTGSNDFFFYRKVGTRKAQAISKICFAGRFHPCSPGNLRLVFGSVAPTVLRCIQTEAIIQGGGLDLKTIQKAKDSLTRELSPIDDIRSTAEYRLRVSLNLLEDFLILARQKQSHVELGS